MVQLTSLTFPEVRNVQYHSNSKRSWSLAEFFSFHVSRGNDLPCETKIEPDRRIKLNVNVE